MKIPDVSLRVQLPGEDYTLQFRKVTTPAAVSLKVKTGFTILTLANGVDAFDPQALQALIWLCRYLFGGPQMEPTDTHFELGDLDIEMLPAEPPLDPVTSTIPESGDPDISESSPTSSESEPTPSTV